MPADFALRSTIRYTSRWSIGFPKLGRRTSLLSVSPRQASKARSTGTVTGMVAGLLPLPTRCRMRRGPQRLLIVLDPDCGGLGGAEGVYAEQVDERAAVRGDGLSDLKEADQLEPVQPWMWSRRCALGRRAYTAGSAAMRPSMGANRKNDSGLRDSSVNTMMQGV